MNKSLITNGAGAGTRTGAGAGVGTGPGTGVGTGARTGVGTRAGAGVGLQDGVRPGEGEALPKKKFWQREWQRRDLPGAIFVNDLIGK